MATSDFQKLAYVDDVDFSTSTIKSSGVKKTKLKIALIGETGSGKTSFINAIQGHHDDEDDDEDDGTIESKPYCHPLYPDVTLWDHPGLDTLKNCDPEEYFKTFYLERFDAFLLFIKANPTKTDQGLAKKLDSRKKPFFLIRTKIDNDLAHCRRDKKKKETLEKIKESSLKFLADDLGVVDAEKKLFLISNFNPNEWDFDRLRTANLYDLLPSGVKPTSPRETAAQQIDETINVIDKKVLLSEARKKMEDFIHEIKERGVEAARKKMETALTKYKEEEIKLAIIGESGVGKSSFINALRGMKNDESGAAETGVIETTTKLAKYIYPHPKNSKITLCDLPGIGSTTNPDFKTYSKKFNLRQFDEFVVITTTRFSASEVELTNRLRNMNKPFLFVRTKIDVDESNEEKKEMYNEKAMLDKIKKECAKDLKPTDSVYLISNNYPRKWDFPLLVQAILNKLSLDKQVCFVFSMYIVSESVLEEKVKKLRGRIYKITFLSVLNKLGGKDKSRKYDHHVIKKNVKHFKSQFGIPDKDTDEFKTMSANLQEELQKFDKIDKMGVDAWLKMFATVEDDETIFLEHDKIEDLKKKLSIPSEVEDCVKPFWFVYNSMSFVLHEMSAVALKVLHEKMDQELSFKYN